VKAKVFTVRLDRETGQFDDSALTQFLDENDAISITEHLVEIDGEPALLMIVSWRPVGRDASGRGDPPWRPKGAKPDDPRAALDPTEQAAYDTLRTWRNDRARRIGKPAYALFTNQQMVELIRQRPRTLAALGAIPGFGDGRLAEVGAELLGVLAGLPESGGGGSAGGAAQIAAAEPPVSAP